jgi:hypothetical protein
MSYVLGHFSRATHVQGETVNIRLSTAVKLGKRFAVAGNNQLQKVAVRGLNRLHQTSNFSTQDVFTRQTEKVPKEFRDRMVKDELSILKQAFLRLLRLIVEIEWGMDEEPGPHFMNEVVIHKSAKRTNENSPSLGSRCDVGRSP